MTGPQGFAYPELRSYSFLARIGSGVEPWQYAALSGSPATDATINLFLFYAAKIARYWEKLLHQIIT